MELQESMAFVKGCFREEPASCECACPFRLDIRSFLKKMSKGRWPAAYRDLCAAIPFPAVTAALCPRPCETRCQRSALGDAPLSMGALERACVDFAASERPQDFPVQAKPQRVAVVGAGPAGLACALVISRKKYQVTVFDRAEGWGGHLRTHPQFDMFEQDFEKQFAAQSVDFRFGTVVDEVALADFDAVYIATGDPAADFGLRESWDPALLTTARPGWFMGGGVCGMSLMDSMAAARRLSQLIEAYLQTGRASLVVETETQNCEGHFVEHPGEASKPLVEPADGLAYSKDEAKAEADRCMQCVCEGCMRGCELMEHYRKTPMKLAADICGDSHTAPPFSNCVATRQTYSCNLCGRCGDNCPEGVDMGALFRFSREDRWQRDKWIPGIYDYWLRTLDFNGDAGFYASPGTCEQVFFPGCQLTASKPVQTLGAWHFLRERLDAGVILGCCGAPAVWAGDQARQGANLDKLRSAWEAMGRPEIIAACATCADMLRRQLPEAKLRTLYEVLDGENAPVTALPYGEAAIFDPCAARRDDLLHRSVLSLTEKAGCKAEELHDRGNCCGYGGHIRLANPELYQQITEHRAGESDKPYVVYCANCLEVFRAQGKPAVHVLDAVFPGGGAETPSLERKRKNTLEVKGEIMETLEGKTFVPEAAPWDGLKLEITDSARANMEEKLITDSDVAEAVFTAEQNQDYFEDETGLRTACLERRVLTYWVDYRAGGDAYAVESAYCHRMHIGEGEQT